MIGTFSEDTLFLLQSNVFSCLSSNLKLKEMWESDCYLTRDINNQHIPRVNKIDRLYAVLRPAQ